MKTFGWTPWLIVLCSFAIASGCRTTPIEQTRGMGNAHLYAGTVDEIWPVISEAVTNRKNSPTLLKEDREAGMLTFGHSWSYPLDTEYQVAVHVTPVSAATTKVEVVALGSAMSDSIIRAMIFYDIPRDVHRKLAVKFKLIE